jgi:hypothetical protein
MGKKKVEPKSEDDQVTLKPFLGIRPGVYLSAIYLFAVLLLFFLFFVNPGIRKPQAAIMLATEPEGAAMRVNGVYMGTSNGKIIVPAGSHEIEIVLPGFETERLQMDVPGRIFGSAFFPKKYQLYVRLNATDPTAAVAASAAEFASWSFGGEPTSAWQVPLALSEGAYRAGSASRGSREIGDIIAACTRFTVTRAALRDLVRARALSDNGGQVPSPASIFNTISGVASFLSDNPGAAAWLASILGQDGSYVISSDWFMQEQLKAENLPVLQGDPSIPARRLDLLGISFLEIPGGSLFLGEPFPHEAATGNFYIGEALTPFSVFKTFLDESGQTVSPEYGESGGRITGVSWNTAREFCKWMSGRLPSNMTEWEVRLPAEAEWEYAAKLRVLQPTSLNEWCEDPYSPLPFFKAASQAVNAVGSPERSVRCLEAGPAARTSLPDYLGSPYVSFRPVIALKDRP